MTTDLFNNKLGSRGKPRCYATHKDLPFGKKGGVLVGASCSCPREGYDVYIGFDWNMKFNHQKFPWEKEHDKVLELQFSITDMSAPKSSAKFKKMVTWVCAQLGKGARIHVGCIGGHGRTGLFIAAVRAEYNGDKNAGQWTRANHCVNAIESQSQINFLSKHYGIKKIKPSKKDYKGWVDKSSKFQKYVGGNKTTGYTGQKVIPFKTLDDPIKMQHLSGKGSIRAVKKSMLSPPASLGNFETKSRSRLNWSFLLISTNVTSSRTCGRYSSSSLMSDSIHFWFFLLA